MCLCECVCSYLITELDRLIHLRLLQLQRLGYKMASKRKEAKNSPDTNGSVVQNNVNNKPKNVTNEVQQRQREKERSERESIVLWKQPVLTLEYFFKECIELVTHYGRK